jgi:hypothetical protein
MPSSRTRVAQRVAALAASRAAAAADPLIPPTLIVTGRKGKIYARELSRLELVYGKHNVTPQVVVKEAKKERSPLHDYFDWDIRTAAEKHWLAQARALVRVIRVTYIDDPGPQRSKRAIVTTTRDDGKRGYTGILSALSSQEQRNQLIQQELRIIHGCKERLKGYREMVQFLPQLNVFLEAAETAIATTRQSRAS